MEKRISNSQFKIVKDVARAIDPLFKQRATIQSKINTIEGDFKKKEEEELLKLKQRLDEAKSKKLDKLNIELHSKEAQIEAIESGVVKIVGFHASELVKKVIEPTGKVDDNGKPVTTAKYLPTDMVKYDEQKKEYVITTPDDNNTTQPIEENTPVEAVEEVEVDENAELELVAETVEANVEDNTLPWD